MLISNKYVNKFFIFYRFSFRGTSYFLFHSWICRGPSTTSAKIFGLPSIVIVNSILIFQEWIKRWYREWRRISRTTCYTRCRRWRIKRHITIPHTLRARPAPPVTAECTRIRTRHTRRLARLRLWRRSRRRIIHRITVSPLPDTANRLLVIIKDPLYIRHRPRWPLVIIDLLSRIDLRRPCPLLPATPQTGRKRPRRGHD